MQQKCGLQGYHTNFVIRGFFRLGWWTNPINVLLLNFIEKEITW
jgi:hypothetical protein